MKQNNLPKHIAIIPDGNRRWATKQSLPTLKGHLQGKNIFGDIVKSADEMNIHTITIWGFSTENWKRSEQEIKYLMVIFEKSIKENLAKCVESKRRFVHLGRKDRLNKKLIKIIEEAEDKTKHFSERFLAVALDYGGKDEIVRAVNLFIKNHPQKNIEEKDLEKYLDTNILPYPSPDLVIRTGGEHRISGFMIWQTAYSEYIFLDKFFPEFLPEDLENSIKEYQSRQRRFGK